MLTQRRTAATATLALAVLTLPAQARAVDNPSPGKGGTECGLFTCRVEVDVPGESGGGGQVRRGGGNNGGGGNGGGDGDDANRPTCTYELAEPQPPAGSLDWDGHKPGDGAVYEENCVYEGDDNFTVARMVWAAEPPEGAGVDPAVLAQQAVDEMLLRSPEIGITPKPGGKGVVGMPVYMWTKKGPETYGPNTTSASAGGITVTATAKVSKIVWQMGDGKTVTCTTAGTPYKAEYGKKPSPDCGHRYAVPSSTTPSGKFHVTATSTWTIDWQVTGGGQTGQLTEIRESAVDINVAEVQVLN
ncbi:ATP/GTP-binding protein [Streptomyces sp. 8N706]|uniref:ATP/GTP-binding protein n=1 Tax=Streptomyces sp. 8N706 TaxID=3457416 RepID=UPI003FD497BD